jgi:hypothetical protein
VSFSCLYSMLTRMYICLPPQQTVFFGKVYKDITGNIILNSLIIIYAPEELKEATYPRKTLHGG